jgi:hypothetical protein
MAVLLVPCVRASRIGRPSDARSASGRGDFKLDPVSVVPTVLTERPVREVGNVDGGAAVMKRIGRSRGFFGPSPEMAGTSIS